MTITTSIRLAAVSALALTLGGCIPGERGVETAHQPIVGPNGAHVPGCPDWSDARDHSREGQSSNFGCATASNLAAMIADPQDLLHGRSSPGPDAAVAVKAVKAAREKAPTGAQTLEKTSAKGS